VLSGRSRAVHSEGERNAEDHPFGTRVRRLGRAGRGKGRKAHRPACSAPAPHADGQQPAATPSIEDALRTRLGRAGYTDIEMVPTSFLVRAKDAKGNPVIIEVSPDSATELKVAPQDGQDDTGAAPAIGEKF
jgi:hypothetical protein